MARWFLLAPLLAVAAIAGRVTVRQRRAGLLQASRGDRGASSPGPDLDVVQNNCTACHSADYIQTQPRGPKFKKDFWQAEVTKMIKVYGAPIDEADIPKIVDYLASDLLKFDSRTAQPAGCGHRQFPLQ